MIPAVLSRKEAELYSRLDAARLPQHVAIIMDGNGRWANKRHLPRIAGHSKGMDAVRKVVNTASLIPIPYVTLYAFSAENWKRPKTEVSFLMRLLRHFLKSEMPLMMRNNVRMRFIGRIHALDEKVQQSIQWAIDETAGNTGTVLTLAVNYGARSELTDAFQSIVAEASRNGGLKHLEAVDEATIARHLYTSQMPDPDLVIRTSGEMRLSNFLLWQMAYSEIYVTPKLWPDFTGLSFLEALEDFQTRERRYGGLGTSCKG
jgi:undecaprenyl diphosphate synthase